MYKIQLYLTIPIAPAKSEKSISALGKFHNFNRCDALSYWCLELAPRYEVQVNNVRIDYGQEKRIVNNIEK